MLSYQENSNCISFLALKIVDVLKQRELSIMKGSKFVIASPADYLLYSLYIYFLIPLSIIIFIFLVGSDVVDYLKNRVERRIPTFE